MAIKDWFRRKKIKVAPDESDGKKDYQIRVIMRQDGFIPAIQFSGDNLETLLEASTWAYACISGNAEAIASLPAIVQRAGDENEDKWVEVAEHPLNDLIKNPFGGVNGLPHWSWGQLIETVSQHLYITGNSWLDPQVVKSGKNPRIKAVYLLQQPGQMTADETPAGVPTQYRYGVKTYKVNEVVNIMNAAPGSLWNGQSPLHAAFRDVNIDRTAHERQKANLENRVAPGVVVEIDGYFGPTEAQKKEILKELTESYTRATQDGTPFVVGKGAKLHPPIQTGQVSDIFDVRKFSRDGMLAVFRTPPPIVGIYENATLQNFATATKIWWLNALFPMLNTIYGALNNQLVWPVYGENIRLWYDVTGSDIGLLILKDRVDVAQGLVNLGYPTNMASRRVGLGMGHVEELDQANTQIIVAGRGNNGAET